MRKLIEYADVTWWTHSTAYFFSFEDDCVSIRIDKSFFKEIPDYDPDKWNPISEFEPGFSGCYLVTREAGSTPVVDTAFFDKATNEWKPQNSTVTAFRELPEPYQPEENKWNSNLKTLTIPETINSMI